MHGSATCTYTHSLTPTHTHTHTHTHAHTHTHSLPHTYSSHTLTHSHTHTHTHLLTPPPPPPPHTHTPAVWVGVSNQLHDGCEGPLHHVPAAMGEQSPRTIPLHGGTHEPGGSLAYLHTAMAAGRRKGLGNFEGSIIAAIRKHEVSTCSHYFRVELHGL